MFKGTPQTIKFNIMIAYNTYTQNDTNIIDNVLCLERKTIFYCLSNKKKKTLNKHWISIEDEYRDKNENKGDKSIR